MALLLQAILNGATSATIKSLIENGAAVNIPIPTTRYPLDAAIDRNNARIVQTILKHVDYDINKSSTGSDNNLLHRACNSASPRVGIVRSLLEHGINVNHVEQDETPLHLACQTGNKSVVQLLIDYGADVNYSEEYEETPLCYALMNDHARIVDLLLQNGAEIYTILFTFSAILEALNTKAGKLLIRHAANLNAQTKYTWTKLSSAIFEEKFDLVKQLIDQRHDIDILCLYTAVVCGPEEILDDIWSRIPPELISNDLNFMVYVFESWKFGELGKLFLFLRREDVDLHLERCGKAFAFFMCRIGIYERVHINNHCEIITSLVTRGLRLAGSDAEIIISHVPRAYRFIIQEIINLTLTKISLKAFVDSTQNKCDTHLLQYCLEANSTLYSNDIFLRNIDSWQYYLELFTVPNVNKHDVIDRITRLHGAEESECLSRKVHQMNAKSLKELCRDTIRESLSKVCTDSRHLLNILDSLKLPRYIRNLIQCKEPVNL